MATKDNNAGLLSKMARFVLNPTKDWSDLEKPALAPGGVHSKQALKEMIERKRQNDFVRRREFDQLRRLRRNGPATNTDPEERPSFFQSSATSNLDERATTLKKIDEIEADMSKLWWKGRQEAASAHGGDFPVTGPGAPIGAPARASMDTFQQMQTSGLGHEFVLGQGADYESTQMGLSGPDNAESAGAEQPLIAARRTGDKSFDTGFSEFSSSKLFSIELSDSLVDPDLEEAAIRFANGDDAGAEAGLLAVLQADNVRPDSADGWAAALFDLYRATGQQSSFDRVAIDFAQRFGRSSPAWFSTPELLGHKAAASSLKQLAALATKSSQTVWACPETLDFQALQVLRATLSQTGSPWHLNWSRLETITPDAAKALAGLFAEWCLQPVKLHFGGADVLEQTLRFVTPSGDKRVDSFWWWLRLDALRILRLQDEFELAALDYCVTYEVSPPPWAEARCDYVPERVNTSAALEGDHGLISAAATAGYPVDFSQATTTRTDMAAAAMLPAAVVELSGEVLGDAADALDKLQTGLKGADRIVISCARLIRVDFSAAGSILNWVAVRESEGCHVQFHEVPRLVAAFFNVIGINEHARVILRTS